MSITSKIVLKTVTLSLVAIAMTGTIAFESAIADPASAYASEKIVYNFTGGADGGFPYGQLAFSGANIVGTTYGGLVGGGGTGSQGTVFTLTTKGIITTLHNWNGGIADGEYVTAGVAADEEGNLYGTTEYGGASNLGIIYKLDTNGVLTVLHSFSGCGDGGLPIYGSLVLSQGVLYGVTSAGQINQTCPTLSGTAFQIDTNGSDYKVTNIFNDADRAKDGYYAVGAVALANGSVFGTTEGGGDGLGTVFQIDAAGKVSALLRFKGGNGGGGHGGGGPTSGVIVGKDGRLYGTTGGGGKYQLGAVFAVDTSGKETLLHSFSDGHRQGFEPFGGLVQDANGNLYGTTTGGGTLGNGTVFEVTAAGTYITLHEFKGGPSDGQLPFGTLVIGPDGDLYGTTVVGGSGGKGIVFRITPNQ